jgi:SHS2 domain-containing protein
MSDESHETASALDRYKASAQTSIIEIAVRATVAAIPYAGGAILELWNGRAQRRSQERLNAVFEEMKKHLESTSAERVNQAYFDSEEFQTLLYLIIERLHTTHDAEKLKMFGDALANSGKTEFASDDKETFVRILRDLSAKDIQTLDHEYLKNWFPHVNSITYEPDVLSSFPVS